MLFLFISNTFIKLLLITTEVTDLGFITLVRYYFHFSSKVIFCLMLFICYGIGPLLFTFSSLFLFLTFFFFPSCLCYFPAVSFLLTLGINAVKWWLSRMQGRVASLSVWHFAEMSRALFFLPFVYIHLQSTWATIFIFQHVGIYWIRLSANCSDHITKHV